MPPMFSIILPTYNRAHLIEATIERILKQSFTNFELIVIDDASTDNTISLLNNFQDERLKILKNETNLERSASRNKGIHHATGEWIAFCDSDDHWKPNHLAVLEQAIVANHSIEGLYFTQMTWNFPDRKQDVTFPNIEEDSNVVEYLIENQIGTPCVCVHHSILKKFRFNPEFRLNEDVDLYAKIATKFPVFKVGEYTVNVHIHDSNTQTTFKDPIKPQIEVFKHLIRTEPTKSNLSKSFAKNRLAQLKHQRINLMLNQERSSVVFPILEFLIRYPSFPGKKIKLVGLLYHLPGGNLIKKLVRAWK